MKGTYLSLCSHIPCTICTMPFGSPAGSLMSIANCNPSEDASIFRFNIFMDLNIALCPLAFAKQKIYCISYALTSTDSVWRNFPNLQYTRNV